MARSPKPKDIVVVGSKIKEVVKEAGLKDADGVDGFSLTKVTVTGLDERSAAFDTDLTIDHQSPVPFAVEIEVSPVAAEDGNDPQAAIPDLVVPPDELP